MTTAPSFTTVFAIWPGMTHLDFTGPHQVLSRLPGSQTIVASPAGGNVPGDGLVFADTVRIADVRSCDLICVPGGVGATQVAQDLEFITNIRRLGLDARYITSVCTGSLILGAAGLLKGAPARTVRSDARSSAGRARRQHHHRRRRHGGHRLCLHRAG
jgi:cyclohexyl-isocyanide hydratase